MAENGQNGCKVFASIAKFGETKFKPIRKHENNLNTKLESDHHQSKRTKVEENQSVVPKSRVNKFFKSRNASASVLEETNKPKVVTANITPIRNESRLRAEKDSRYREEKFLSAKDDKALKIKLKKEKETVSPKKTPVQEKQSKKQQQKIKIVVKQPEESPYQRPTIKPIAVSNQTRYSTRSRRVEPAISASNDAINECNQVDEHVNDHIANESDDHMDEHFDNRNKSSNEEFVEDSVHHQIHDQTSQFEHLQLREPIHQTYDIKEKYQIDTNTLDETTESLLTFESSSMPPVSSSPSHRTRSMVGRLPPGRVNEKETIKEKPKSNRELKKEATNPKDDFVKFFMDENEDDEVIDSQNTVEEQLFTPMSQSIPEFHSTQQSESEVPQSVSQPVVKQTSPVVSSTMAVERPVVLPQKKRFFSKTDKEKKVQYNMKNFFASSSQDAATDFDEDEQANKAKKDTDVKLLEYDSDKLKKVKEAHKCAELGEAQHYDGEIKFYLSGIKDKNNTTSIRCLSILGLTGQCLSKPELRMHLRAHDYMGKIIRALMDSPKDPNLALCAACLMFVYNQDRLTMDIDPNALSLMLELLETKADQDVNQIEKNHREKVMEFCKTMKKENKEHGKYLKLNEISAGTLAMETLLGLTSKRAGDWFKEELRNLKGIDYLIDAILNASNDESNAFMEQEGELNKIDRSLRVIENVTCGNKDNQVYVIDYKNHLFINRCMHLYELCKKGIIYSETTTTHFLSPLLSILRVFINLTSDTKDGCARIGESIPHIFDVFVDSVFELPSFVVPDSRFDLIIFLLCLCLNLIESCDQLHDNFIKNESQIKRLIVMLEERYEEAKKTEQQADDFLDSEETQKQLNAETINIDTILTDLVAKSGKHMEHTIIAACISLLIGSGLKDNYEQVQTVRRLLPNNSFTIMVDVITKLKEFSNLASIMTKSGIQRVESILAVLKHITK